MPYSPLLPPTLPRGAPPAFHLLAKPTGALCNLACDCCLFLSKELLYPGSRFLNDLCAGYKAFFTHIDRPMRLMADLLRQGRYADEVMALLAEEDL